MKQSLKKWRLALALVAIVTRAGVAWAANQINGTNATAKVIPEWVNHNLFGDKYQVARYSGTASALPADIPNLPIDVYENP
jgi:hypothetical protein